MVFARMMAVPFALTAAMAYAAWGRTVTLVRRIALFKKQRNAQLGCLRGIASLREGITYVLI